MRHFLRLLDLSPEEAWSIVGEAERLAKQRDVLRRKPERPLLGQTLALIFDKPSTRTRVSFTVAMHELGGQTVELDRQSSQLGRGEPIEDAARVLSRYLDAVAIRTHAHAIIERFAAFSSVPVINALTDDHHPCQLLADVLLLKQRFGELKDLVVAWVGDGNNVAHSWIEASALFGFRLRIATPKGYEPKAAIVAEAEAKGARLWLGHAPEKAVAGANVVVTDVWASMGQEGEAEARKRIFAPYQVNESLMAKAASDAIFLHCLPAHRGEEVSPEVLEGPQSAVWDEAENRLHAQKALLLFLLA